MAHLGPFERKQNPSLLPSSPTGLAQCHEPDPFDQFCRNVPFQLENWVAGLDFVGQNDEGEDQDHASMLDLFALSSRFLGFIFGKLGTQIRQKWLPTDIVQP